MITNEDIEEYQTLRMPVRMVKQIGQKTIGSRFLENFVVSMVVWTILGELYINV